MADMGKIFPIINGGLGNQLFKIGCAFTYAAKLNRSLCISKKYFIANDHQTPIKTFDTIEKLFPCIEIISDCAKNDSIRNDYKYSEFSGDSFKFNNIIDHIPENIKNSNCNIVLDGYFINPMYLDNSFKSMFTIKPNHDMSKYGDFSNYYFIHIRLGDYVNNQLYNIPLELYYKYCIESIKSANNNAKFIICTNERSAKLKYYIEQFPSGCDYNYSIQDIDNDELDTLYIMASCSGGICSNSTLSWMGCYLQGSQRRENMQTTQPTQPTQTTHRNLIFMPYPWINFIREFNHDNTIGIYPDWCRVYNTYSNTEVLTIITE